METDRTTPLCAARSQKTVRAPSENDHSAVDGSVGSIERRTSSEPGQPTDVLAAARLEVVWPMRRRAGCWQHSAHAAPDRPVSESERASRRYASSSDANCCSNEPPATPSARLVTGQYQLLRASTSIPMRSIFERITARCCG